MDWSDRIGRRIRLRDLHVLLTAVQCKSMSKAAEHLAISKPVISKVIADLEHALGVRLLERNRHGVEPTLYGAALLKRGTAIFDELRESVKDIESLADPAVGEVRIGCNPVLASSLVATVMDRLIQRYPRIVFHIVATDTEALQRDLIARNVDLLIAWRFLPFADEQTEFEMLCDDSHVVAAVIQNPWAQRRKVKLANLMSAMWTLPPPVSAFGAVARDAFRASGLDYPRATVFAVPADVRLSLLATGHFLTLCSTSVLRFSSHRFEVKVLPVDFPMEKVPIGVVHLKKRTLSPLARLFINTAREIVGSPTKRMGKLQSR